MEKNIRLNKYLSQIGVASRRSVDRMIEEGSIQVNGKKVSLGALYEKGSKITIEGQPLAPLELPKEPEIIMLNKPTGVICTHADTEGRALAIDLLSIPPQQGKWIMVGRLDLQSSGLLLFTNHGDLAAKLMHPSSCLHRIYEVKVQGLVTKEDLERLTSGISLEDGVVRAKEAVMMESTGVNTWIKLTLQEGKNREIRRMMEALHKNVLKLKRIQFGPIKLDGYLEPGECRKLTQEEMKKLLSSVEKGRGSKGGARGGT